MTDEELITAWMSGTKTLDIAGKFSVRGSTVTSRIHLLRKKGVKVPRRNAGHAPIDVDGLNSLIEKLED